MTKMLMVDDDPLVLRTLGELLALEGFEVTSASNVPDALRLISAEKYDVLLSDLHMPGHGDGLTVVSAMRHANPAAVTLLQSAFPEMGAASRAILSHADEIIVKPADITTLVSAIRNRLTLGPNTAKRVESVATILERYAEQIIGDWYSRVEIEGEIMAIHMTREMRCAHLPQLFRDLVVRLRSPRRELGTREVLSPAAEAHGITRQTQGYSASMMVEESRQLQVCVFRGLQENHASLDFSIVLNGVIDHRGRDRFPARSADGLLQLGIASGSPVRRPLLSSKVTPAQSSLWDSLHTLLGFGCPSVASLSLAMGQT